MIFKSNNKIKIRSFGKFAKYCVLTTAIFKSGCSSKTCIDQNVPFCIEKTTEIENDETGYFDKSRGIVKFKNSLSVADA